jgi:hypothetical protein
MRLAAALAILLVPASSLAEPVGEDDPPRSTTPAEHTSSEVEGAPVPGQESGQLEGDPGDSTARRVGRGVLIVPKLAIHGVLAPVRAGVWAYDRYHLKARALRLFFNKDETAGVYPVAELQSQYGLDVGARFVHRDLAGEREHLLLHAGTGGRYRSMLSARVQTGDRLGSRLVLELEGRFERRPHDRFYGLGNDNAGAVGMTGDVVEARFREQLLRSTLAADLRLAGDLHLRAAGAVADFELGRSDEGPPIDELYPVETMVGFAGVQHAYAELELRWDTRRPGSVWDPPVARSAGWLLAGFAGRVEALDDGADYYRYGIDLQRFVRLGTGPRVLSGRFYAETVSGDLTEVPLTQLPRLGGKALLRGYALDRFRDRTAAVGSIEYAWDLSRYLTASTFVDAGRVFGAPREVTFDDLRVGYGISIAAHTERTFLVRATLASSIDGGVFLDLAFDPVFDLDPRTERR